MDRFDIDAIDEHDPFEIDPQQLHLYGYLGLGVGDMYELWDSEPLYYPAIAPAHWLMVGEIDGIVIVVPLAPSDAGDTTRCRPIGCYVASRHLADNYLVDRWPITV